MQIHWNNQNEFIKNKNNKWLIVIFCIQKNQTKDDDIADEWNGWMNEWREHV